jgi:hypothetical protein
MFDESPVEWPPFATRYEQPRPAWLITRQLLPEDPAASYHPDPNGLTAQYDVPALVHATLPTHYGSRIAVCSFQLVTESGEWGWTATHQLVPTRCLKRRTAGRRQPDRYH